MIRKKEARAALYDRDPGRVAHPSKGTSFDNDRPTFQQIPRVLYIHIFYTVAPVFLSSNHKAPKREWKPHSAKWRET
jgi:hypothetical protein